MKRPWFVVKRYGYGLQPSGWRGWSFIAGFVFVGLLCGRWLVGQGKAAAAVGLPVLFLAFVVTLLKSDHKPWRWRWGDED